RGVTWAGHQRGLALRTSGLTVSRRLFTPPSSVARGEGRRRTVWGSSSVRSRPPRRSHRRGTLTRKVMTVTAQLDQAAQAGPQGEDGGQPRPLVFARVQTALQQSSLTAIAQHMFSLMLRNMSSDGFVFA